MERYNIITEKFPREIVLLKSKPCSYGKCAFCDYIDDNSTNVAKINQVNQEVLANVKGIYNTLEVINSGNIFDLPKDSLALVKETVEIHQFDKLFAEAHWIFRNHLTKMRNRLDVDIMFKTGVETFDYDFREKVLKKGAPFQSVDELKQYFDSPCIMVGVKGQTKDMIKRDIDIVLNQFNHEIGRASCRERV